MKTTLMVDCDDEDWIKLKSAKAERRMIRIVVQLIAWLVKCANHDLPCPRQHFTCSRYPQTRFSALTQDSQSQKKTARPNADGGNKAARTPTLAKQCQVPTTATSAEKYY